MTISTFDSILSPGFARPVDVLPDPDFPLRAGMTVIGIAGETAGATFLVTAVGLDPMGGPLAMGAWIDGPFGDVGCAVESGDERLIPLEDGFEIAC